MTIFPLYYFPPVSWFDALLRQKDILLDVHMHYRKQQYHNRMKVKGANGVIVLSIPVLRRGEETPLKDAMISRDENWQKIHLKTLESCYRSSPYYEFYEHHFLPFFEKEYKFLADLNLGILEKLKEILQLDFSCALSERYIDAESADADFRNHFPAKGRKIPSGFEPKTYPQVFPGFEPDLSVFDLLCNLGPEARQFILPEHQ